MKPFSSFVAVLSLLCVPVAYGQVTWEKVYNGGEGHSNPDFLVTLASDGNNHIQAGAGGTDLGSMSYGDESTLNIVLSHQKSDDETSPAGGYWLCVAHFTDGSSEIVYNSGDTSGGRFSQDILLSIRNSLTGSLAAKYGSIDYLSFYPYANIASCPFPYYYNSDDATQFSENATFAEFGSGSEISATYVVSQSEHGPVLSNLNITVSNPQPHGIYPPGVDPLTPGGGSVSPPTYAQSSISAINKSGPQEGFIDQNNDQTTFVPEEQLILRLNYVPPSLALSANSGKTNGVVTWKKSRDLVVNVNFQDSVGTTTPIDAKLTNSWKSSLGAAQGTFTAGSISGPHLTTSGDQTLTVTVTDPVTGVAILNTIEIFIDDQGPSLSVPKFSLTASSSSATYDTVATNWTVTNSLSGVAACTLTLNSLSQNTTATSVGGSGYSAAVSLAAAGIRRVSAASTSLTVQVTDNAGNVVSTAVPVYVPQMIASASTATAQLNPDQSTLVTVPLNIKPSDLAHYSSLSMTRVGPDLPAGLLTTTAFNVSSIVASDGITLLPNPNWTTDINQNLVYLDSVPVGATGGRVLSYTLTDVALNATGTESPGSMGRLTLPHHAGSATGIVLIDSQGNKTSADSSSPYYNNPAFKMTNDGTVSIQFTATGVDQDEWDYEIDRVTANTLGTFIGASYESETGANALRYAYTPSSLSGASSSTYAPSTPVSFQLYTGTNCYCITWTQSFGTGSALSRSAVQNSVYLCVNFDYTTGTFALSVMSGLGGVASTTQGIIVRPGQPIGFNLSNQDPNDVSPYSFAWDFGDLATNLGSTNNPSVISASPNSANVSHQYYQQIGQQQASCSYSLLLTITNTQTQTATSLTLTVQVRDTQSGTLYTSETWNGAHTVTGVVVVPAALSLTVGNLSGVTTAVSFQGGLGSGFYQGITVDGTLTATGATFDKVPGQSDGWGTILVEGAGSATLNGVTIADADRGLTVGGPTDSSLGNGPTVSVNGATLTGNTFGLHMYGISQTRIDGSLLTSNTVYGVKEDAHAMPIVSNSFFGGNGIDYYAFGTADDGTTEGPLSIQEINQLQSGRISNPNNKSIAVGQ